LTTDLLMERQPGRVVIEMSRVRTVAMVIGFAGGAVGFSGFFVPFFPQGTTTLSNLSNGSYPWFWLVPIFTGMSALALLAPRFGYLASGMAFVPFGTALGVRGFLPIIEPVGPNVSPIFGYGTGFWMVIFGSGVLAAMWLVILTTRRPGGSDSGEASTVDSSEHVEEEGNQPGRVAIEASTVRLVATVIGIVAGAVAFSGFFVPFFTQAFSALSNLSDWSYPWFWLVPIFTGLSVLGLLVPRIGYVASGMALIPLGVACGVRGFVAAITPIGHVNHAFGRYGTGFWMIVVGAGVLSLMWLVVLTTMRFSSDSAETPTVDSSEHDEEEHQPLPVS
jgi:hypothetical protein